MLEECHGSGKQCAGISFWTSRHACWGSAPSPGLAAPASSRTRLRRGSRLRMTSKEGVTQRRHKKIAAKRRKRSEAVTSQRSRRGLAEHTDTLPQEVRRSPLTLGMKQLNRAHKAHWLTRIGLSEHFPRQPSVQGPPTCPLLVKSTQPGRCTHPAG